MSAEKHQRVFPYDAAFISEPLRVCKRDRAAPRGRLHADGAGQRVRGHHLRGRAGHGHGPRARARAVVAPRARGRRSPGARPGTGRPTPPHGISRSGEIIDLGVDFDIIKKSGSWFSYGDSKLAQGRDASKKIIEDNPELAKEIEDKIMEKLKDNIIR